MLYDCRVYESAVIRSLFWAISHKSKESRTQEPKGYTRTYLAVLLYIAYRKITWDAL